MRQENGQQRCKLVPPNCGGIQCIISRSSDSPLLLYPLPFRRKPSRNPNPAKFASLHNELRNGRVTDWSPCHLHFSRNQWVTKWSPRRLLLPLNPRRRPSPTTQCEWCRSNVQSQQRTSGRRRSLRSARSTPPKRSVASIELRVRSTTRSGVVTQRRARLLRRSSGWAWSTSGCSSLSPIVTPILPFEPPKLARSCRVEL